MTDPRGVTVVDEYPDPNVHLMFWKNGMLSPDRYPLTLHHMASLVEQLSAAMRLRLMDPRQPAAGNDKEIEK